MSLISENLKLLHLESGLTFEELSEKTGIDDVILRAFENDKLVPDDFQLEILCRVLKMPYEDIAVRNLHEERKNATVKMRSGNTRETYNWYFGNRKVFFMYLFYVIYFVVAVTTLVLIYVNKFADVDFKEYYAVLESSLSMSYNEFVFYYIYEETALGLTLFGFGVAAFIVVDYLRRHQFYFRWWMLLFIGTILSFLRIFGIVAAIPYLVIVISNLIKGKY